MLKYSAFGHKDCQISFMSVRVYVPVVVKDDHVVRARTVIPVGEKRSKGRHSHLQRVSFHACHEACLSNGCLQCSASQ